MINADRRQQMQPGTWLINTGRGPLLDESAVAEALRSGQLAGAALDVLSSEPPSAENPLLHAPNCIITPHMAWATVEARHRLMGICASNIQAFLAGESVNVVN
jgi:glycerate dehydrogenase